MPILSSAATRYPLPATGYPLQATGSSLLHFFFILVGFGGSVDSRIISSGTIGTASG